MQVTWYRLLKVLYTQIRTFLQGFREHLNAHAMPSVSVHVNVETVADS